MAPEPPIDRRKHDVDVLEHVFKGVHTEPAETAHAGVADFDVQDRLGGLVVSAVRVRVTTDDESDEGSPL
jgi:hypothetical protein